MILAIDCGSSRFPLILEKIEKAGKFPLAVKARDCHRLPIGVSGVIISGAPILLTQKISPILSTLYWIRDCELPVLGICFGHQLLGILSGAQVYLGPESRGDVIPEVIKKDPLFDGIPAGTSFCSDHTEGINLPEDFTLLAKSDDYEVEAMRSNSRKHYGVQFHPEDSGPAGERLIKNFLSLNDKVTLPFSHGI